MHTALLIFRLLNAFAEEQATEDAIYYMGEALRKGVIELDVFLKVCVLLCYNVPARCLLVFYVLVLLVVR